MATIIDSNGTPTSESSALSVIDVTLDIRQNRMVSVLLKQYNKQSQQIKFTVTDNGEKIELKEIEHTVLFKMMTPDGRRVSSYCAINENDHTAVLTVAKNYCSYPGKGTAELEVMDALEESQVGTMNLDVVIENSAYPDEMINGSSTYQGLDEKINAVREACNSAITAKEETETIRDECDGIRNTCNDLKEEAQQYKNEAMSYANGESGTRYGEETDNAKYFYEQSLEAKTSIENLLSDEKINAENIANYATLAENSKNDAENFASNAAESALEAVQSATQTSSDKEAITDLVAEVNKTFDLQNEHLESMESLLENTPYTTVKSEGEFELPVHTINDSKISDDSTWSSKKIIDAIYPVGAIYMSVNNVNPSELFGGTWVAWGAGRVPVGVGTGTDSNGTKQTFSSAESSNGEYTHKLTEAEMPKHSHQFSLITEAGPPGSGYTWCRPGQGTNYFTSEAGSSNSHNNMPPYITCYMWKRTA